MAYVPPEYPGEIPEFAEIWPPADDVHWMFTAAWDAMVKELRAVQIELGTDPAGTFPTVKARLDDLLPHFHDRGDPADYDFVTGDFTTDNAWHDLDLSSIVPAGTKAISVWASVRDDLVGSIIRFRKNGNTNDKNVVIVRTQVANIYINSSLVVPCDTNRVIEYKADAVVFTVLYLQITGWWK